VSLLDTESVRVSCPYCGEVLEILIDPADPASEYIEDCQVCCRPITMRMIREDGATTVLALSEDEY